MGSEQSKQNAQMPSETPASGSRVTKLVMKSHVSQSELIPKMRTLCMFGNLAMTNQNTAIVFSIRTGFLQSVVCDAIRYLSCHTMNSQSLSTSTMEIHQFQPYKQPASLSFTFCYMTTSNTRKRQRQEQASMTRRKTKNNNIKFYRYLDFLHTHNLPELEQD